MRAEELASSGQLPNMLAEAARDIPAGMHTYLKSLDEDPTPHAAAFLLARGEHWYFFASTGWLDSDWVWSDAYDRLSRCGRPRGLAVGMPAPTVFTRQFDHCAVMVNCTNTTKNGCRATVDYTPLTA